MIRRLIFLALCGQALFLTASKCSKDSDSASSGAQSDMPAETMDSEPGSAMDSEPAPATDESAGWHDESGAGESTGGEEMPE